MRRKKKQTRNGTAEPAAQTPKTDQQAALTREEVVSIAREIARAEIAKHTLAQFPSVETLAIMASNVARSALWLRCSQINPVPLKAFLSSLVIGMVSHTLSLPCCPIKLSSFVTANAHERLPSLNLLWNANLRILRRRLLIDHHSIGVRDIIRDKRISAG